MAERRRVCPTCGEAYGEAALFCPRDGAPLGSRQKDNGRDPYVGSSIAPGVRVERLVGIGSMGRVYRAHQAGVDRAVAVKVLLPEHARSETLVARFQREARVAGGLVHPNVVVVHATGHVDTKGGAYEPYLIMEFLDGLSLRSALVASDGGLPALRAVRIVLQICDAMGEAHGRGIVHRDLKPENVMLIAVGNEPDFVKVLDFGVARVGEADSSIATHAGAVLGTATYACPESARGDPMGPRGDVYSIATILFECLAGRAPFIGKGPVDVLIQHAQTPPPDLRSVPRAADVPEPIARVIAASLAKAPEARPPNARELGRALLVAAAASSFDIGPGARTLLGGDRSTPAGSGRVPEVARTLPNYGPKDTL